VRLNLGAGHLPIEGFEPRDGAKGDCLYPLPDAEGSVLEIRASHVLEHFSHRDVAAVLKDWVAKLEPGGRIRIAVPDFEKIARDYLAGENFDVQGYTFGGHTDDRDIHMCGFDRDTLTELLLGCGLERLHDWTSEIQDAAALPISLNIGAYKPTGPCKRCEGTTAVLSAPRFGPVAHFRYAYRAFTRAGVLYRIGGGAYWHQIMSEILEEEIADPAVKYVITCDYDSLFRHEDVLELYRLMEALPSADAILPLESKRQSDFALFSVRGADGKMRKSIPGYELGRQLVRVNTGHFGLTIFRADRLRDFPRPWMGGSTNKEGRWSKGKVDPDIEFWHNWRDSGRTLYLAPQLVVGHMLEMVAWPGKDLKTIYQTLTEYDEVGIPEGARR
jgi:hypothetical protein